ncbi:MAG: type IV secretion system protein [Pseudoxanthomonas sp.]
MFARKSTSPQIDKAVARSVNFEISLADMARRSERRAWLVASSAMVLSLVLAAGYFYMLPLKEKVPYLVMADAYTGTSSVARLREDSENQNITTMEAVNRSNVAHFLLARESYDIALMNLRDWTTVYTMSSPDVAAAYTTLHNAKSPSSPFNVYGKGKAIRVRILSISFIGGVPGKTRPKGATVRFQRSLYDKATGATKPLDSNIATIEFTYKPNLKMDEKYRIENPLGFQVTSYRVDRDYDDGSFVASPPPDAELPAMQSAADLAPAAAGNTQVEGADMADPSSWTGSPAPAAPTGNPPPTNNSGNGTSNQ